MSAHWARSRHAPRIIATQLATAALKVINRIWAWCERNQEFAGILALIATLVLGWLVISAALR